MQDLQYQQQVNGKCKIFIITLRSENNTRLLITDTDSLCNGLHEKNLYKKMYKYKELFDLSNFPVSSKYYCSDNKKVLDKMKDMVENQL